MIRDPGQPNSEARSLAEVHNSVGTAQVTFLRRMFAFSGPAYLVSVGYMDPGNWATDLEGGARFGYQLLWVLVMSNAMAILLQTLSARLGIVTGRDLAQACRETYPRRINLALWALCEVAIAACDLAEVLGAAIALNLLFHIPLLIGVLLTAADTLLLLWFQGLGIRTIEAFVLSLITVIGICFAIEIFWAKPSAVEMFKGLGGGLNRESLYVAIGIIGATVMPHNLYLHSALVQTRHIGHTEDAKRAACRYNLIDSSVALNGALLVNAAILVLAAAVFFKHGVVVTEIQQAHELLVPLVGDGGGRRDVRGRAAVLGAILHLDRNHGRAGSDGGLPEYPYAALAAPADYPHPGHCAGGPYDLPGRRQSYLRVTDPEPGGPEYAVAVRRDSPDPVHQRPFADGSVRQSRVGTGAGVDHGGHHRGPQPATGRDGDLANGWPVRAPGGRWSCWR